MLNQKSIAVLPFANLSSDTENEYFSDGITEEIINALSKIEGLKVTARTSSFAFKGKQEDVRLIGNQLGVETVIEGSVRKSGNKVRIATQLIRTDNGFQIWSERFDRELADIFELQDEISLKVAEKIRENYGHLNIQDQLVNASTDNIEAYQLYLKGKYYHKKWNLPDIAKGAQYYEQSLKADPKFDLPYFGAGLCYGLLGSWGYMDQQQAFDRAEDFFNRGEKVNSNSGYSYFCIATQQFWGYWKYKEGFETLQKAYAINPGDAEVNEFLSEILTALGDFDNALKYIDTSIQNNPLSPNHFYTKANILFRRGDVQEALRMLDEALILDPVFELAVELKMACLIYLGNQEKLLAALKEHDQLVLPRLYEVLFQLLHNQQMIASEEVDELVGQIQALEPNLLLAWDLFLLANANDEKKAIASLKEKTTKKMGQIVNFKNEPFLNKIKDTDDFKALVQHYFPVDHLIISASNEEVEVKEVLTEEEITAYSDSMHAQMNGEQLFLEANLSLSQLAEAINLHPNRLSWLLNDRIGKNFRDYVNGFRIEEFKKKAILPEYSHLTLLGLAYECGFNSKSVFNEAFKKNTGTTPKAWVKSQKL